jgi:hypothetical protein
MSIVGIHTDFRPHMLRGGLVATYNFWFGVGQFAGAIALQVQTQLVGYKQTIYAQFVFIGVMVIVWFAIPESPCELSLRSPSGSGAYSQQGTTSTRTIRSTPKRCCSGSMEVSKATTLISNTVYSITSENSRSVSISRDRAQLTKSS